MAFGVSEEDLEVVLEQHGEHEDGEVFARAWRAVKAADGRIEKAALRGNSLDEQTEAAHEEITAVLREAGILPAPVQPPSRPKP